MTHMSKL